LGKIFAWFGKSPLYQPMYRRFPYPMSFLRTGLWLLLAWISWRCNSSNHRQLATDSADTTVPTAIRKTDQGYELLRYGKPYFIQGAGCVNRFEQLRAIGGNSVRTWDTHDAQRILDEAHKLGMTVTLGLWVGRWQEGFEYKNQKLLDEQYQQLKKEVLKFKDHPALLMWCVGNEWNQDVREIEVFDEINRLARMVHEVDPNHPVTTALSIQPARNYQLVVERCRELDILSINVYKELPEVPNRLEAAGWKGPYILSEFGIPGYWQVNQTPWEAPIEPNSREKYELLRAAYSTHIASRPPKCLGGYAFFWGHKQEQTRTWYSYFDETGKATSMVELIQEFWIGKKPTNLAPVASRLLIDSQPLYYATFAVSDTIRIARFDVRDPDGDPLHFRWDLRRDTTLWGDLEFRELQSFPEQLVRQQGDQLLFRFPPKPGLYRLYAFAYDNHGHVATANMPFQIEPVKIEKPIAGQRPSGGRQQASSRALGNRSGQLVGMADNHPRNAPLQRPKGVVELRDHALVNDARRPVVSVSGGR